MAHKSQSTRGNTKVLSLPVIIAQNNVQAVLNVGSSVPFVQVNQSVTTGTVPTTVQTIQYIDVGTTLTITPTINGDGYVNMTVDQDRQQRHQCSAIHRPGDQQARKPPRKSS